MRKSVLTFGWMVATGLATAAVAQEPKEVKPTVVEEAPGPRLRVRFLETRVLGEKTRSVESGMLTLHPGDKGAYLFVGSQVALRTGGNGTPTVSFKNAGVQAQVGARVLPDGRYELEVTFEEGSVLGGKDGGTPPPSGDNPILQVVKGESRFALRGGESVLFATAVDPVTGETVRIEVSVEAGPARPVAAPPGGANARLRARLLIKRRQGEKTVAQRPYSVVLQAGETEAANVFSGAMLPLEVSHQGQPTVMLKDVGAGVRLNAHRIADGRYRLDLSLSDGTVSAASGTPRVQAFQVESRLYLVEGETLKVASAVDPDTGEVVEAEVTLEAGR